MSCQWVFEPCKTVAKPEFIIREFWQCRYIEWENDYQKLHLRLSDTILNQAVLIETILEVNEMLLEHEEAAMDVVNEVHEDVNTEGDEEADNESDNGL